ncbi:MAG: prolyl aminopeptidase, partial [Rhodospirillales bacterium]|nr:prolyl aminopeptidase [Rhodospirillales bacterium]
ALAYGQAHPQRCLGFVLRGVFLFSRDEVEWFMRQMGRFFPEARRAFLAHLSAEERGDALGSYYRRLTDTDPAVHTAAAAAWCAYEEACSRLIPPNLPLYEGRPTMSNLAMARIEAHYMVHAGFLAENQLLDKVTLLRNHPAAIIQGRYDVICPIVTADSLVRAWPGANYRVVPDAGHSAMEPGIRSALVAATQQFRAIKL